MNEQIYFYNRIFNIPSIKFNSHKIGNVEKYEVTDLQYDRFYENNGHQ